MSTANPTEILDSLDIGQLRDEIAGLDRRKKALTVLLRAALTRGHQSAPTPPQSPAQGGRVPTTEDAP